MHNESHFHDENSKQLSSYNLLRRRTFEVSSPTVRRIKLKFNSDALQVITFRLVILNLN